MKKIFLIILILITTILQSLNIYANDDIRLFIDGKEVYTDTKPVIIDNRVFIPLRIVSERLSLTPTWNGETKEITITGKNYGIDTTLILQIGSNKKILNGVEFEMDVEPCLINDVTFIPARYVVEAYNGYSAWWSISERTIHICTKTTLANADAPDFSSFANTKRQYYENRPSYIAYYDYNMLYNGMSDKYIKLLEENGYTHTMQPSGQVTTHKLTKNGTTFYIGEDLYNWAMFITCQYPGIIEVENDHYTSKFPSPSLK
ncbi:MAG: copper amine oxidase N-terminal domain-containing protein [Lachnospirales bacterium]